MAQQPEHRAYPWRALSSDDSVRVIERWHQTLKNRILLENYYLPGDLETQIAAFVADYNHLRYHESIGNLTPADVYFGRGQTILIERERIKRQTIANRRLMQLLLQVLLISQTRGARDFLILSHCLSQTL